MNSGNGFRRTKGDYLRAAAGVAVLIAAAVSTAALWAMALSDSGAPSASSAQQVKAAASVSLANLALTIGGVLVAVLVVVVAVGYGRRIARRRAGVRRGGMHAKTPGPRAGGAISTATDPYPSWPGRPGPYALHPDHPSWPGCPDPRWPSTEAILREDDCQHSPERQAPPWLDAVPPVPENGDRASPRRLGSG